MEALVILCDDLKNQFLSRPGVYFDPVGGEIFILEYLGEAPCVSGEMIPKVRIHFSDECKQGAAISNGQEIYLGEF